MRSYASTDLQHFLRRVDAELPYSCQIVLIGGGAVALAYKSTHTTTDLDLWTGESAFWAAVKRIRSKDPTLIPVHNAAIAEPPYDFESRLRPLSLGLAKLSVLVPEPHDLVLMKTARAEAHDLDAIEDIHREIGLSLDVLVERFHETKEQVTGRPEAFVISFQAMVARLFGDETATAIKERLIEPPLDK